tara:strand:- start:786 stop:962 length:177 start_codon:yes stop_codon:yes gene_type:complete
VTFGCSSNNCSEEKKSINDYYDQQVQHVKDNAGPTGPDYRQIGLLEDEREKKLNQACN